MKVLKFGGTSVGSPERMNHVADLITRDQERKIVVLSAVSGTTNALVEIGDTLKAGNPDKARELIKQLYAKYLDFYNELLTSEEYKIQASGVIEQQFNFIKSLPSSFFNQRLNNELLAQGELLSTKLFELYTRERGIKAQLIPALDFMFIDENKEPDYEKITSLLTRLLDNYKDYQVLITQGFIARNIEGEIDNLKRGGSDYTASIIGSVLQLEEIQIWTDIDGMHNNDPRVVKRTFPLSHISFNEASELAYFGAKILHPSTIIPAQKYNVPVRLLNTMEPEAKGTLIDAYEDDGVKAIAAKDGITAIKIKSGRMLMAYGFLRRVFEIFERYKTPIDMITTSEVAVSLTIDNDFKLPEIVKELELLGNVWVDGDHSIVCIAGKFTDPSKGVVSQIFNSLSDLRVRMISYGGSNYNISILIDTPSKVEILNRLNDALFK